MVLFTNILLFRCFINLDFKFTSISSIFNLSSFMLLRRTVKLKLPFRMTVTLTPRRLDTISNLLQVHTLVSFLSFFPSFYLPQLPIFILPSLPTISEWYFHASYSESFLYLVVGQFLCFLVESSDTESTENTFTLALTIFRAENHWFSEYIDCDSHGFHLLQTSYVSMRYASIRILCPRRSLYLF